MIYKTVRFPNAEYRNIYFHSAVFFLSFFTAVISTSIHSHTIRFHVFISNYVVKLVSGTIL